MTAKLTKAQIFALPVHPVAALFPWLTDKDAADLASDIAENGLTDPLVIYQGELLDGRNRRAACQKMGITPDVVEFAGKDPVAFILSKNLHRRHLSPAQRAMLAAEAARMAPGRPKAEAPADPAETELPLEENSARVRNDEKVLRGAHLRTNAELAEDFDVGQSSIRRARAVHDKGSEKLVEAVKAGDVSLKAAERAARTLTPEEQDAALAEGLDKREQRARRIAEAAKKITGAVADAGVPAVSDDALLVVAMTAQLRGRTVITARELDLARTKSVMRTPLANGGVELVIGKGPL